MHVIDTIYFWGRTTPEHPAIISPKDIIRYARLAQAIESAADYFELNIRDKSKPVGVLINSRSTMVVAILGLLHAGFTVVPVDPTSLSNLKEMNSGALVHEPGCTTLSGGTNLLFDDFLLKKSMQHQSQYRPRPKGPQGKFIYFSSGTTGKPKPVVFDESRFNQQQLNYILFPDYERIAVLLGISVNTNFSDINTSKTTTAVGRNTAPSWVPRSSWEIDMCSAPRQGLTLPVSVDLEKETVITGRVVDRDGQTVGGAFVRLLDSADEFTAEVVASATGEFRFFAAPGSWTLRALSRVGNGDAVVAPSGAGVHEVDVKVA